MNLNLTHDRYVTAALNTPIMSA